MRRLTRIVALLLVPCLLGDPVSAAAISSNSLPHPAVAASSLLFNQEALSALAGFFGRGRDALNRHPTVTNDRQLALRTPSEQAVPAKSEGVPFLIGQVAVGYVHLTRFDDGEFKVVVEKDAGTVIQEHEITLTYALRSADDAIKILLMSDNFKRLGAAKVHLVITQWELDPKNPADSDLLSLLRFFADDVNVSLPGQTQVKAHVAPAPRYPERPFGVKVRRLLYIQDRFKDAAEKAKGSIHADSGAVHVRYSGGHWNVQLPEGLAGQNAVIIHSSESSENIIELLLTLMALQREQVNTMWLINTYEGYARQDKVFLPGGAVSAVTLLKLINRLVGNRRHFALNVHYGERTGEVKPPQYPGAETILNLNGFVLLAERAFVGFAQEMGHFDLSAFPDRANAGLDVRRLKEFFDQHPLVLAAPDDGSYIYAREAAKQLEGRLGRMYGVDIPIHVAYFDKVRAGSNVTMNPVLLTGVDKRPFAFPGGKPAKDFLFLVPDDVVSRGSTQASAIFNLHVEFGVPLFQIFAGAVHWRGTEGRAGLGFLDAKLSDADVAAGKEPVPDFAGKKLAPRPDRLITTDSLTPSAAIPANQVISIQRAIDYIVKRVIGQENPWMLLHQFGEANGEEAEAFGIRWPWSSPGIKEAAFDRLMHLRAQLPLETILRILKRLRAEHPDRFNYSDEDLKHIDVLIGDTLWVPTQTVSTDHDLLVLVPGQTHFADTYRHPINGQAVVLSVEGVDQTPNTRIFPVVQELSTLIYGSGELAKKYGHQLTAVERLEVAQKLLTDAIDAEGSLDLESAHKVWMRSLAAYLMVRPLLTAEKAFAFERGVFSGQTMAEWLPSFFFGNEMYPGQRQGYQFVTNFEEQVSKLNSELRKKQRPGSIQSAPVSGILGLYMASLLPALSHSLGGQLPAEITVFLALLGLGATVHMFKPGLLSRRPFSTAA